MKTCTQIDGGSARHFAALFATSPNITRPYSAHCTHTGPKIGPCHGNAPRHEYENYSARGARIALSPSREWTEEADRATVTAYPAIADDPVLRRAARAVLEGRR